MTRQQRRERQQSNQRKRKTTESAVLGLSLTPYQRFYASEIRGYRTYTDAIGNLYYVFKTGDGPISLNPEAPYLFLLKESTPKGANVAAEHTDPIDGETRVLISADELIDELEESAIEEMTQEQPEEKQPDIVRDAKTKTKRFKYAAPSTTLEYVKGEPKEIKLISIKKSEFVVLDIDEKLPPGLRIKGAIARIKTSRGSQYIIPRSDYVDQGLGKGLYEQISEGRGTYDIRTREKRYFDAEGNPLPFRNNARTIKPLGKGKAGGELRKIFSVLAGVFQRGGGKAKT